MRLGGLMAIVLVLWGSTAAARPAVRVLEPAHGQIRRGFLACEGEHQLPPGTYSIRLWIDDTGKPDLTELVIPGPVSNEAFDCIKAAAEQVKFPALPLHFMECELPIPRPGLHVPWQTRHRKIEGQSPAPYGVAVPIELAPRPAARVPATSACAGCTASARSGPRRHLAVWLLVAALLIWRHRGR